MTKRYRCFFCDEIFVGRKAAFAHFGEENCETDVPACVDPLRTDEKARSESLREGHKFYFKSLHLEEKAEELMYALEQQTIELRHYFGDDCTSLWSAADRYKNVQFELKLAREEIEALKNGMVLSRG